MVRKKSKAQYSSVNRNNKENKQKAQKGGRRKSSYFGPPPTS
jgi:hypothetical protein